MKRFLLALWKQRFIGTFLAGLFAILPLLITFWIMDWVAGWLRAVVGPGSAVGNGLRSLGLKFVTNELVATAIGWILVVICIWLIGFVVSGTTRYQLHGLIDRMVKRIPVIKSIYGPVNQVVEMFAKQDESAVSRMKVVYCSLGTDETAGFLGLLATSDLYRFNQQDCHIIYLPSAPMPMTGFNLFVPAARVRQVPMSVEQLMQIYFSLGLMTSSVVPSDARRP